MTDAILALDLASKNCGWCLYHGPDTWRAGTWTLGGRRDRLARRLVCLGAILAGVLTEHRPALVAAEVPDYEHHGVRNSANTLRALYLAYGVTLEACRAHGIPAVDWSPHLVRSRLCGSETASKEDAQQCLVWRGYTLPRLASGEVDHDAADALALACVQHDQLEYERRLVRLVTA